MSLQLYIGPSGSGKSHILYNQIIKESLEDPDRHYYVIVPDQFTMQTQKDIVLAHPDKGIMNVEVLSFGRLSHRIFEETGQVRLPVLDDTGKNLILRRLASKYEKDLNFLSANIRKPGYIQEIKSSISEFMQYGIDPGGLEEITEYSKDRISLQNKLKDLEILYKAFLEEIKDKYVTTEGQLGLLEAAIQKSSNMKDSTVVFDGFTGFTPIQLKIVGEILLTAREVRVSVIMDPDSQDQLFSFSRKMINALYKTAEQYQVKSLPDVYISPKVPKRFESSPVLAHLERNILRDKPEAYKEDFDHSDLLDAPIALYKADDPASEVRMTCNHIKRLVRLKGYNYRDIALVAGDLSSYSDYIKDSFKESGIPLFLDSTKGISHNPFIEYIKTAYNIIIRDFSYDTVFAFLRCGFPNIPIASVDLLENYVLKYNIRGKKAWTAPFKKGSGEKDSKAERELAAVNETRAAFMECLEPLMKAAGTHSAREHTDILYSFILASPGADKLRDYEERFAGEGDRERASEYSRVYMLTLQLLEQIYAILGEEELTLGEYLDVLDAGLLEITLGNIPQDVDRITAGDMERTRLKEIKVLFFLGVNDGNIPGRDSKGGLISDIDREFLQRGSFEMAPGPREKMIIQRHYLYMNMTKPDSQLILSYCSCSSQGDSIRPSYIIRDIKRLFPGLKVWEDDSALGLEVLEHEREGVRLLSKLLGDYARGIPVNEKELKELYLAIPGNIPAAIRESAFFYYRPTPLSEDIVKALYGTVIKGSVSRLEKYCECGFRYFLQYGLSLKERELYGFEAVDMGSVCHRVLEEFSGLLAQENKSLKDFADDDITRLLEGCIDRVSTEYGDSILSDDERHKYIKTCISRIMKRTVKTLRDHLQKGDFVPAGYEQRFSRTIGLSGHDGERTGTMQFTGSIDRVDVADTGKELLVRILDYKTGNRSVDTAAIYYGLQLQLAVYLSEGLRLISTKNPGTPVLPAGILYYRMRDPLYNQEKELSPEGLEQEAKTLLRTEGFVVEDDVVLNSMDRDFSGASTVVPVIRKADGSLSKSSGAITGDDMETLLNFTREKISSIGDDIVSGKFYKAPYELKRQTGCKYCPYKGICGFEAGIPGYNTNKLKPLSEDEAFTLMKQVGKAPGKERGDS